MSLRTVFCLLLSILCWSGPAAAREIDVEVAAGVRLHVIDAGPRDAAAPTLLLVPGWRFSGSIWADQVAAFSNDRRVVAIDPRSQGLSTKTAEGDTPEQRAQDLHALIGKLGLGRSVLVGWSQGVQDVAAFVTRYGTADIAGIVLIDSTISKGAAAIAVSPGFAARQLALLPMLSDAPRDYTEGMMRAVITRPFKPGELDALVNTALETPSAIGAAMLVADLFGTDRSGAIDKIDRPTMVVASPRSAELDEQRAMASRIRGAEFHVVENAGHGVFVDRPADFNALLARFLERLRANP